MVTLKKILAPTDFSTGSVPAIGYALSLAKEHGSEVIVTHTLPNSAVREGFSDRYAPGGLAAPTEAPIGGVRQTDVAGILERKKQVLRTFLEQRISPELLRTVKIRESVRVGRVVAEIVAAAKEEQCDLIVMTSHAGRLRRLLHGSYTERVQRRAPCPVLSIQPWAEIRTEENKRVPVRQIEKWAA